MAGIANSWIETYYNTNVPCLGQPIPTAQPPATESGFSSCIVWLIVGVVLGSITFSKKGSQQS